MLRRERKFVLPHCSENSLAGGLQCQKSRECCITWCIDSLRLPRRGARHPPSYSTCAESLVGLTTLSTLAGLRTCSPRKHELLHHRWIFFMRGYGGDMRRSSSESSNFVPFHLLTSSRVDRAPTGTSISGARLSNLRMAARACSGLDEEPVRVWFLLTVSSDHFVDHVGRNPTFKTKNGHNR
jgi:hypothetical protein